MTANTAPAEEIQRAIDQYAQMRRIRSVELAVASHYAELKMRCPVHLSVGQEAIAVGVCSALTHADQAVSTHRCHAHYLAKGGDLKAMLAEMHGKAAGCCGGRGGSMHLFDTDVGMLLSLPIVASSIPVGVGAAFSFALRGQKNVAVVFLGDASLEVGVWHESANFAARHKLPVIFVCENNQYSVYTNLKDRQPDRPLTCLADAHAIRTAHVDGNDVDAVYREMQNFVALARNGEGPSFLLADTYRWLEHCGPNYDNDIGYRSDAEFQTWRLQDPIEKQRKRLVELKAVDDDWESKLDALLEREISEAFSFADDAPYPLLETATEGVYV
jgi:pyruvate dehydrogenase E1 component alpha subunit